MQQIYEKLGFITVTFYERPRHILFDWTSFAIPFADLKDLFMKAYDVGVARGAKTLIAETSKVKDVLFNDAVQWWGDVQVPRLSKAGIVRIITVVPQTSLGRWSTKSWQGVVAGIELHNVGTLADAVKLVV
jgi:hypothetical protein